MNTKVKETHTPYRRIVPSLESGDVLDRDEYFLRGSVAPKKLKSERINRRVYLMMSPLRAQQHGNPHALLAGWLFNYTMSDPDWVVSDNATILLDLDNDPQPDLCLYREGGQTRVNENGYLVGPPELIVEIAGSSASYDFGEKRDVYEAAGVGEYIVFETLEGRIEWWHHDGQKFVDLIVDDGVLKSRRIPGLWLNMDALRSADAPRLIETLNLGLASV